MQDTSSSQLASLISERLQEISGSKTQKQVSIEVGFQTPNMLSIVKNGQTKLSLDRVAAMAKSLNIDLADLMLPALRQYYSEDVIDTIRSAFSDAQTQVERDILALARKHAAGAEGLSHATRERIKDALKENVPAGS